MDFLDEVIRYSQIFFYNFLDFYDYINSFFPVDALIFLIIAIFVIKISFKQITKFTNSYFSMLDSFTFKVYRITIPNSLKDNDVENKKDAKQVIAGLELFFMNLGGLSAQDKKFTDHIKHLFRPRTDHFSLEIINDNDDLISFYVSMPDSMEQIIKQQFLGVWPDAYIEDMPEYNIFKPQNKSLAGELSLKKHYTFPIRTYQQFEIDPLDLILNSISKFTKEEGVTIQIVTRSAKAEWRKQPKKLVSLINEGRTVEQAYKAMNKGKTSSIMNEIMQQITGKEVKSSGPDHKHSPAEQELIKSIENKLDKPGLDVNIRIIVSSKTENKKELKRKLTNILDSFSQYSNYGLLNSFKYSVPKGKKHQNKLIQKIVLRKFDESKSFVLCSEELITLFHLPLAIADIPNIRWLSARTAPATFQPPKEGTILGSNEYRGITTDIKISQEDRMRHMYIIGKSGTGKTNLLKDLAIQDAIAGHGMCIIDPHGDFAENVLSYIPKERAEDVVYFDPSDLDRPLGLNLYEFDPASPEQKTLIQNQFIDMLYVMYGKESIGGPMFEYYTKGAMGLNMEDPDSGNTMIEISRVMADKEFRDMKLSKCKDPLIKNFWLKEAEKAGGEASLENIVPYITSKLGAFINNEFMRNIVGQQKSSLNFSDIMNTKKILICNFAKGKIGDMNSQLLGLIVTGRLLIAALERTKLPESERHPFFLYIDECQNFLTPAITTILAEARKYSFGLILANQFIGQLTKGNDTTIKDGIFGNAGTLISYRISTEDAEFMEKVMAPVFTKHDLENPPSGVSCCKTLCKNSSTKPFTLKGREYWKVYGNYNTPEALEKAKYFTELSRLKYGRPRDTVSSDILGRLGVGDKSSDANIEEELAKLFGE